MGYARTEEGFRAAMASAQWHCRLHPEKPIWIYVPPAGSSYEVSVIEPDIVAEGTLAQKLTLADLEDAEQ